MERTGRKGRGTRRLFIALAAGVLLVAVLAGLLLRERREGFAPEPGAAAAAAEDVREGAHGMISAPAGDRGASLEPASSEEASAAAAPAAAGDRGAERVAVPLGPRGRVIDSATGAPMAGVVVERSMGIGASTGPDGVFAFRPGMDENETLWAVKAGWRFTPASLQPRYVKAGEELLFEGQLIAAPVRGRIVDEATGAPVQRYELWLGQPGFDDSGLRAAMTFSDPRDGKRLCGVQVRSDAEGRFVTPANFERGKVHVRLLESSEWRSLEHVAPGTGVEHEIAVRTGPTYRFDLELPPDVAVEHLSVTLVDPPVALPRSLARAIETGWMHAGPHTSSAPSPHGLPRNRQTRLRTDGDPAWARLPPLDPRDLPLPAVEGYAMQVSCSGGRFVGLGFANSISGLEPGRIPIVLKPCATLRGTVVSSEQDRIHGAWVTLYGNPPIPALTCITDELGTFSFHVPLGRYELALETVHGSLHEKVELGPKDKALSLQLTEVETMRVAGSIESQSGRLRLEPRLELRSIGDAGLRFTADVDLYSSGERSWGIFQFKGVPRGSYELFAPPCAGFGLEPSRLLIDQPAQLKLVCLDGDGGTVLELAARGAGRAPLSSARAWFWVDGDRRGPSETLAVASGAAVRWLAFASGYLPAEGVCEAGAALEQRIDVQLERGAGIAVFATGPSDEPIEGAEILLDGRIYGHTDERGLATLVLRHEPLTLGARKRGWVCVSAKLQPGLCAGFVRLAPLD